MKIALRLISAFLFLSCSNAFSQQNTLNEYKSIFSKIDSLASNQQAKSALVLVNDLNNKARKTDNPALLIKSVIYRILFQSYLDPKSVAKISTEFKQDITLAKQPEKSILQSLLAESYWRYYQENSYRISQRTYVNSDIGDDIQTWSARKLTEEIIATYMASISETVLLQNTKIDILSSVLTGDSTTRYLRPTLYDLLAQRAIETFSNTQIDVVKPMPSPRDLKKILTSDTEYFISLRFSKNEDETFTEKALTIFQDLLKFHKEKGNNAAFNDVNFKRIQFIYPRATSHNKDSLYFDVLQKLLTEAKGTEIYSDILYEQAFLYKNDYFNYGDKDSRLIKAIKLAEDAIKANPNSHAATNSHNLIKDIKSKSLSVNLKLYNQPGKPVHLQYFYRNIDSVFLTLYKINHNDDPKKLGNKPEYFDFIKTHKKIRDWSVKFPANKDFKSHNLADQFEGLPHGRYILIAQSKNVIDTLSDDFLASHASFTVTNMNINRRTAESYEREYIIVNSTNGAPLKDVEIEERMSKYSNEKPWISFLKTDAAGYARTKGLHDANSAIVSMGPDTVSIDIRSGYYGRNNKPEYERVILFTDRPIYRPGQTVYYKGLCLDVTDGKNKIMPFKEIDVTFKDVNRQDIKTVSLKSNEYGTFQGSFDIPIGKLNGSMNIVTSYGNIVVQVEEYKRPTFQVLFDKPEEKYKLNDSITVRGHATAFSGYTIGGATVNYTINGNMGQVASGTVFTEPDGSFSFKFFANKNIRNIESYNVNADITDLNGETRSASKVINVGETDILINVNVPNQLFLSEKTDSLHFRITNLNGEPIKSSLNVTWFLLQYPGRIIAPGFSTTIPEAYTLTKEEYVKSFPNEDYSGDSNPNNWKALKLKTEKNLETTNGAGAIGINSHDLKPGYYKVLFAAKNTDKDTVSVEQTIRIYSSGADTIQSVDEWLVEEKTLIKPDENAVFRLAGLTSDASVYYEINYQGDISEKVWLKVSPVQTLVKIKPKPNFSGSFAVQFTMTQNGVKYSDQKLISIIDQSRQLDIKFLSFRNKLEPGEKETWKLKISNKAGEKQMAELAATLYDASLDDLRMMNWQDISDDNYYRYYLFNWTSDLNEVALGQAPWFLRSTNNYFNILNRKYEELNLFGFRFSAYYTGYFNTYLQQINLQKIKADKLLAERKLATLKNKNLVYGIVKDTEGFPIPGVIVKTSEKNSTRTDEYGIYSIKAKAGDVLNFLYIGFQGYSTTVKTISRFDVTLKDDKNSMEEVVIRGYQKRSREQTTGSSFLSLGKTVQDVPVSNQEQLLQGKVAGLNIQTQKTTNIRGISTKLANIVPRVNFNESAFFYPQLHTNESGEINIEFIIPQSLTRYKMLGFAHTKDLKTALVSKELITQKQLAISANAPRFFREGDTIVFSAKLNNLSGKKLNGKAALELTDALTGNIIQIIASKKQSVQKFELDDKGNVVVKWPLIIPSGVNAIGYKLIAESGKYTDGEQMIIPVLPNAMLVTETMPLNVRGGTSKSFTLDRLLQSGKSNTIRNQALTLEFTSNPAWYAIQALPYLMEYPYECAEQTFSRFYANSFASGIINSSPKVKQVFDQWQSEESNELSSNLEKNQELKSILLEETPWVRAANSEKERKRRLSALFNLNRMSTELKSNFEKLEKMQYPNGAFPWFNGMRENRYITQQIVLGMAQLKFLKLADERTYPEFAAVLNKAIIYLDSEFSKDYIKFQSDKTTSYYLPLHYLYARSYSKQINTEATFLKASNHYLKQIAKEWKNMGIYQQGLAALTLHRNGNHSEAVKIINSLKDRSLQNDEMGMYWSTNIRGWWWYQSPIETQALMIEAFDEITKDSNSVEEMKIWLLKNKQTSDWKTTKATTAACYALLMQGQNFLEESAEPEILVGGKSFKQLGLDETTKEAGTGYQKIVISAAKVKPEMGQIDVKNNNKSIAWGGVYWQYFEQLDKITPAKTGVQIKKQLFLRKRTAKGDELAPLNNEKMLKTGDLVKVRIEINTDRDMEYVHLKDMRSSGFEPTNVISGYKYQDGLGYYETTKDASTNFFMDYMRKGVYVFEYSLRINHAGNFSNGITSLQCMYAPEFSSFSEGIRVTVKE